MSASQLELGVVEWLTHPGADLPQDVAAALRHYSSIWEYLIPRFRWLVVRALVNEVCWDGRVGAFGIVLDEETVRELCQRLGEARGEAN